MKNFTRWTVALVLTSFAFLPARGAELSSVEIQDLAERAGSLNSNVKSLRSSAREFDAAAFATELEKLEREAKAMADDASDLGAKSVAKSLGDTAASLKKVRRQVQDDESYFTMELTRDIDARLSDVETRTDQAVQAIEKLAPGAE